MKPNKLIQKIENLREKAFSYNISYIENKLDELPLATINVYIDELIPYYNYQYELLQYFSELGFICTWIEDSDTDKSCLKLAWS